MIQQVRSLLVRWKNSNPFLFYLWLERHRKQGIVAMNTLEDRDAINQLFKNYTGRFPNLENPTGFGDKMQWLKLNYHNPLQTTCSDKYEVRDYIAEQGYGETLNELHQVVEQVKDFDSSTLPDRFVIKAAHGSGWNFVCKNKNKVNWWIWKRIMNSWLNNNIFWPGREWPYKHMKARIVVEKYLQDSSGQLMDYKFFCFNGEVHFVQANKGRDTAVHAQNFYDMDWNILPFGKDLKPLPEVEIPKPSRFTDMVAMATKLSQPFPFVRVDLYETEGRIVFGELTFYPKSGLPDFTPPEYDHIIGDMLKLPDAIHENGKA